MAPIDPIPLYALYFLPLIMISFPGLSSVPAKREPSITELAPAPKAFTMSPENLIPPSATTGTPCSDATSAVSEIAVICGTPIPAMILVVQMDPGPIPTLNASTSRDIRSWAASAVAMFPAMISTDTSFLIFLIEFITFWLWACAVSTTIRFAPSFSSVTALSISNGPTAAPTRSCPSSSLEAVGNFCLVAISFAVIRPTTRPLESTRGSFSMRFL